jgi:hypothetical protein
MRAHINCVENLPVYAAIVLCATAAEATGPLLDALALILLAARILQTTTDIMFERTDRVASVRFGFFPLRSLHVCHGRFRGAIRGAYPGGAGPKSSELKGSAECFTENEMTKTQRWVFLRQRLNQVVSQQGRGIAIAGHAGLVSCTDQCSLEGGCRV